MTPRLRFIVESGTDVRLVEGLAECTELAVVARRILGGREISQPLRSDVPVRVLTPSRLGFAAAVFRMLIADRKHYDAVLVQGYGPAALAANAASRITGAATYMLVCSPVERYYECRRSHPGPDKPYRARELAGIRMFARWNARIGRRYIVLSSHLGDVVRGHGAECPIDVIPIYGIDIEHFQPTDEPRVELRRRLGIPEPDALIFFSSRVAPEKDAETLLAAHRQLLDAGRDVRILNLSGGHTEFLAAAERHGVVGQVVSADAVDPRDDLPAYYRACDLCVQASREEGLGFSPLEALACEVPVVATAVGGLTETIIDGQTGWTYPVGDSAALANRIERVLDNPEGAAQLAARGRRMVIERFERTKVWGEFARLLRGGE